MKESQQFILCLLVAVISVTMAQGVDPSTCREDLSTEYYTTGCRDNDAWIACLEMKIEENHVASFNEQSLENQLAYFQRRKEEDQPCPLLEAEGSCVSKEINVCHQKYPSTSQMDQCINNLAILSCLMGINETCSSKDLLHAIEYANKMKKSCESGEMKKMLEIQQCHEDARNCTKEFNEHYNNQDYEEARNSIEPAMQCLNNIDCDVDRYSSENQTLIYFLNEYNNGLYTGKCSIKYIMECFAIVQAESHSCTVDNVKKAEECFKDLKQDCETDEQWGYYNNHFDMLGNCLV